MQRTIKPGTYDDESQPTRYYYKNELLDSVSGGNFNAKFHYNGQAALQHIQFYTTKQTGEQEATLKQIYLYDAQEKLQEIKYFDGQMYSHRQYLLYDKDGKLIYAIPTMQSHMLRAIGKETAIGFSQYVQR